LVRIEADKAFSEKARMAFATSGAVSHRTLRLLGRCPSRDAVATLVTVLRENPARFVN